MFTRNVFSKLEKSLDRARVVLLNGARQVGKTTMAQEFVKKNDFSYMTFDDELVYLAAKKNPAGFISQIKKPVVLDEVQRVPEIFLEIKKDVDKNSGAGRYLLTGSANPLLIPRLGDSLAGRMEIIDLFPLSQGEINNNKERFIDAVFNRWKLKTSIKVISKNDLYKRILKGGYPYVQAFDEEGCEAWMRSYLSLLLQKDIKDLAQIEKLTELPNLLKILALRASNILNVAEVARDSKICAKTLHRYIALLETIFIINLASPWSTNISSRFIKSPKLYLIDSGLLSYLLDTNLNKALENSTHMGRIFENFVVGELKKQKTWNKTIVNMYHFRVSSGQEVDIVLEDRSGNIVGIEVKSSERVIDQDFNGLKFLKERVKDKFIVGIVLYTGQLCSPVDKDLYVLSINSLWDDVWNPV
jgi:predicted AAA+ superfamily ATPase